MEDLAIIERIRAGDRNAFALLVERHQSAIFRIVRRLVPDAVECEDLAQDVFLTAFAKLTAFDPGRASFRTWLLTIARNRCLNALKRRRPLVRSDLPEATDSRSPDVVLAGAELFQRLDEALAELPFEQRSAFVLVELEGLSLEEVGRVEGIPVGTVKSRLGRAREKLRSALGDLVERK